MEQAMEAEAVSERVGNDKNAKTNLIVEAKTRIGRVVIVTTKENKRATTHVDANKQGEEDKNLIMEVK